MTKIKIPISQAVLTVIQERKLKELLPGKTGLEASGVVAWNKHYYVVFDRFPQIARIKSDLTGETMQESWVNKKGNGPGFEDITYDQKKDRFYTVVEALEKKGKKFKGKVYEFDKDFSCLGKNWINVKFGDDKKGVEAPNIYGEGGKSICWPCVKATNVEEERKGKSREVGG